ncbi:hypothetical protein PILCRDRAFT_101488 [Piloderma croceum F 1598]|uniref:Uncharacterized protein n=1 Tax=Piloderma croceum (strain F 1598) TaxID=765440 RepID=A0A0C3GMW3_PILCF|nr:hypothetical protein PILCRDRAFT_101488 [Piloderma croceum F 1598]
MPDPIICLIWNGAMDDSLLSRVRRNSSEILHVLLGSSRQENGVQVLRKFFQKLHEALTHNATSACTLLFTAFPGMTLIRSVSPVLEPGELQLTSAKLPTSTGPEIICPEV